MQSSAAGLPRGRPGYRLEDRAEPRGRWFAAGSLSQVPWAGNQIACVDCIYLWHPGDGPMAGFWL